ncbi:Phage tail-collar fibre protein [Cohaesibacter sp. ES.047]|uniref:phage tail protein n=1 Tax=Cohaesibacter sp. ES.047 TaxID=1798205 RepID=UPI000BBF6041|nr:phage tail protein [Cohaesibacter sp. ES.047]SNY90085.1 Phage tail-collar fibre protein [Cohaesibacter sp. ES.047]
MTAATYYTRLTNIGSNALSAAITGGASVSLTHLAVGDADGSSYDPDGTETNLVHETHRLNITSITPDVQNPAWLIVEAILPPDVGGWWIREAGLFDANGAMFAIAKHPPTYKSILTDGTASTLTIQIVLQVTNTDSIQLVVNPLDSYASQNWVISSYPWANEEEVVDAAIEKKLVDPKRLAAVLSQLAFARPEDLTSLSEAIDLALEGKAAINHNHAGVYALAAHNHDGAYASINHAHDLLYAAKSHGHQISEISGINGIFDLANGLIDGRLPSQLGGGPAASITHEMANGVDGGWLYAGSWQVRPYNTEDDPFGLISLANNSFTPAADLYMSGWASINDTAQTSSRVFCVTDNAVVAVGSGGHSNPTYYCTSHTFLSAKLTAGKTYRIEMRRAETSVGFGVSMVLGQTELYSQIDFWRR